MRSTKYRMGMCHEEKNRLRTTGCSAGHGLRRHGGCTDDPGPHNAADPGAETSGIQGTRCAQRQDAAALRGQGARGRAERGDRADRRPGLRRHQHLRRPDPTPTLDRLASNGLRYNNFHTTALSSPTRAALKSGRNHHTVNMGFITEMATGMPGATGQMPSSDRAAGRDAAPERLRHGRLRQVARDRGVGGQRRRPVRPLADAPGLRQVLRLPRRRDQPVGAVPLRRHRRGRAAERPELPLHDRHDREGAGLDQVPEGADARQAVLRLLRARRHARAAPRAQGVDRQVEGQVRPGLGQDPRGDAGAADRDGRRAGGHEAGAEAAGDQGLGHALGRREAPVRAPGRGVRRLRRVHRPRDRPHARRPSTRSARPTTRWSSTSPATTAPAAKAARTACSTSTPTSTACRRRSRTC